MAEMQNKTGKRVAHSPEAIEAFFKQSDKITPEQKFSLYRGLLSATLFMLNDDRSKEAKRFKYDFEKHTILIKFIEYVVTKDAANALDFSVLDFQRGLVPVLKMHGTSLKSIAEAQLQLLLENLVNGSGVAEEEKNLLDNPIAFNANMLHELFVLPVKEVPGLHAIARKARDCAAERLGKVCEKIEQEVAAPTLEKIRALWLLELLMQNGPSIKYAWGEWRLTKLIERISQEQLPKAEQKEELSEREQAMAYDLLVASGRINPAQFGKQEEHCDCGHEHAEHAHEQEAQ